MSLERNLTVLYASETGTAQDLAEHAWRESKKYKFKGKVMAMDDYNPLELIHEKVLLFVCATAGQGEEPENMKNFWKFLLRKSLPRDSLAGTHIAVLSLGDSSFAKFNWVGKRLSKRLLQLGASEIIPIGLCDDQHDLGIAGVYVPFIRDLFRVLLELYPCKDLGEARQVKWKVEVAVGEAENYDIFNKQPQVKMLKVIKNQRTTSETHFQDVRYIRMEKQELCWEPGDAACIRAENSKESVDRLFEVFSEHHLTLTPETVIEVKEFDAELPVPIHLQGRMTLRTVATKYWDLTAVPRPRFFELLAINCQNELEIEKLKEFSSPEGVDELYSYANRPKRTVVETLSDFPHAVSRLNLETVFEMFQPIKARSFSIASSAVTGQLNLLVAVVEYRTMMKVPRKGFCSNWLKTLAVGDEVPVWIKRGTFRLPSLETPIVMVGPGTGLAAFLSIIQEREKQQKCPLVLFFGCRNEKADFHCRKQLETWNDSGLIHLITAFSRDQEDKMYVQHRIKEHGDLIRKYIKDDEGYFYVSGSMKMMPKQVREAMDDVLGVEFVDDLIKHGRYQEETW